MYTRWLKAYTRSLRSFSIHCRRAPTHKAHTSERPGLNAYMLAFRFAHARPYLQLEQLDQEIDLFCERRLEVIFKKF